MATRKQLEAAFTDEQLREVFFSYANPLKVFESIKFAKPYKLGQDYREQAIDAALKSGMDFSSTCNTVVEMAKRVISVRCPYGCEGEMGSNSASGGGHGMTIRYHCEACKCHVHLALENSAIAVEPRAK